MDESDNNITGISTIKNEPLIFQEPKDQIGHLDFLFASLTFVALLVIIANSIVVVSSGLLFKKGYEPRSTYLLLGSISMADLLTGIIVIIGWFKLPNTFFKCTFFNGLYVMSAIVSGLNVGFIAIDRYFFIIHAIKYKQLVTHRRVRYVVIFSWIFAILCGLLPLQFFSRDAPSCLFVLMAPPYLLFATNALGIFPVMCVIILYPIILHKAIQTVQKKKGFTSSKNTTEGMRRYIGRPTNVPTISHSVTVMNASETKVKSKPTSKYNSSKWKAIKIVMITTLTYTVTWIPYFISSFIYSFCDTQNTPKECNDFLLHVTTPLSLFTFTATLTNPAIYAWYHNGFRKGIRNIYEKYKRMYQTKKQMENINNKNGSQHTESTYL